MSFSDRLKAKANGQTAAPAAAAPATVTPKAAAKPPAAKPPATKSTQDAAVAMSFTDKMRAKKAAAADADAFAVPAGVVPPDAPPRDAMPEEIKAKAPPVVEDEAAQDDANVAAEAEAGKKTRGRPKGSTARKGFTLYIDCMVSKGAGDVEATTLEDFFGPIEMELNELAAEEKLPSWWLMSFANQKAALGVKVQERIAKGLPHAMLVRSSSYLAKDVLPMLIPHATQIIQRF